MEWTVRKNIEQFRQMIAEESDPKRLVLLETLLAEEEAKLASIQSGSTTGEPSGEA